jgi:GT2 family glycosyltransferase/glycosyltransferase involved in cell wall biosynthesis/SAM-dependent methyltransferase
VATRGWNKWRKWGNRRTEKAGLSTAGVAVRKLILYSTSPVAIEGKMKTEFDTGKRDLPSFSDPNEKLAFDGERYVSGHLGPTQHAHHHRYLFAVQFCIGKDVLDVASGEGYGSDLLAQVATSVVGVDIDATTVLYAEKQYVRPNLRYISASATSMPLEDNSVDVVVSYETIEHLEDHKAFMDEICRVLRPDGLLIISSPNRPIYSDKANYKNPFHIKELDYQEFHSILNDRFSSIQMFAQRQATGSVLSPQDQHSQGIEIYATSDGRHYELQQPFDCPQYFLAIASNEKIDAYSGSVLINDAYVPNIQTELAYRVREVESARAENRGLTGKLNNSLEALKNIDVLRQSVEELKALVGKRTETTDNSMTSIETGHLKLQGQLVNLTEKLQAQSLYFEHSPGMICWRATKRTTYFFRYFLLLIFAFLSNPLSRRRRRRYIDRKIARSSAGFRDFALRSSEKLLRFKWKLKAFRRYPTSSARRKIWRDDNLLATSEAAQSVRETDPTVHTPVVAQPFDVSENMPILANDSLTLETQAPPLHSRLYENWVANTLGQYSADEHVAITRDVPVEPASDVQLIAYYLPQFHPIPENDTWWGKGFTEWRNVARAFPNFEGHYQPRIPGELGYYDLRVPQIMQRQVELAKLYGISAFCFHFYWFGGKTLLEGPIVNFLENKNLDIKYCLCWANENWSRRWDGSEHEVLISQEHSDADDEAFLRYISKYFADDRYLKVDGRPVLTVYRPSILPNPKATVERWRRMAREMGYPDLYLIATNSFAFKDYSTFGFDALSEFPPHHLGGENLQNIIEMTDLRTGWRVRDYKQVVESEKKRPLGEGRIHPGITIGWDNSARKPTWGDIIHNATPKLFKDWLSFCVSRAKRNPAEEQFVFINAWNEWAEGTYLEPDKRFGYAFLESCSQVLKEERFGPLSPQEVLSGSRARLIDRPTILVCSHHAGQELFGAERSMLDVVEAIADNDFNVIVTLPKHASEEYLNSLLRHAVEVRVFHYEQWTSQIDRTFSSTPDFMSVIRDTASDLVYVNTIVLRSPVEAARLMGIPAIVHAREIISADVNLQEQIGMPGQEIAKIVVRSCTHIVANSLATAKSFTNAPAISTVPNIVNLDELSIPRTGQDDFVHFALLSSNLPKKGIDDAIEIALRCETEVPNAKFLIIGPLWREGARDFVNGRRHAPNNVEFIDYIPKTRDALARVDVVLNLSHFQESFGRTVLEAMAAGRPVIVYNWGALPELVEHDVTGIVVPFRDISAAVNAVRQLTDVERLERMGTAAQKRARVISDRQSFNKAIGKAIQASLDVKSPPPNTHVSTGAISEATLDIVICVHNALEDVERCLESVDRHRGEAHGIIIVDDGSGSETRDFLSSFSAKRTDYVRLFRNDVSTGYTKAANTGVGLSSADTIILLNSDTVVTAKWAEKLQAALHSAPGIGIAGPMSNAASYQSVPSVASTSRQTALNLLPEGWGPDEMNALCERHSTLPLPNVPLVHGFCFAIKREAWASVGPFDEDAFPRGFGEENDFCLKAANAGFGMVIATNTFVYHSKSKSYGEEQRHELAEASQEVLYARYGRDRITDVSRLLLHQPQLRSIRRATMRAVGSEPHDIDM